MSQYYEEVPLEKKHSRLGITALIIGILVSMLLCILIVFAGVIEVSQPGSLNEDSVGTIMLGMLVIGGLLLNMVGIGLGIGGLFQQQRKKLFPILGISINSVIFLGTCVLIALGSLQSASPSV